MVSRHALGREKADARIMRDRSTGLRAGLLVTVLLTWTQFARANEPDPGNARPRGSRDTGGVEPAAASDQREWYGWQIMITDAIGVALVVPQLTFATNTTLGADLGFAGFATYALGGPIVHWSHGAVGKGFGSLALRIGAPFVSGAAFLAACWMKCDDSEANVAAALLLIPGFLVPAVIDYAVLGYEPAASPKLPSRSAHVVPSLGVARDVQRRMVPTLSLTLHEF
jgi:hypothetical protein